MIILSDDQEEIFEKSTWGMAHIDAIFRSARSQKNLPTFVALQVRQFNAVLNGLAFSCPMGTDFKYLDTRSFNSKCKINFLTKTGRWSTPLNKFSDQFLASFKFEFGECHGCRTRR